MAIRGVRGWAVTLLYAFVGWGVCGLVMGLGLAFASEQMATILHAVAVPFIYWGLSWVYHRRHPEAVPLASAAIFLLFVVLMDIFVVGLAIQGNLTMFRSVLGVWLPFALILIATYLSGRLTHQHSTNVGASL